MTMQSPYNDSNESTNQVLALNKPKLFAYQPEQCIHIHRRPREGITEGRAVLE